MLLSKSNKTSSTTCQKLIIFSWTKITILVGALHAHAYSWAFVILVDSLGRQRGCLCQAVRWYRGSQDWLYQVMMMIKVAVVMMMMMMMVMVMIMTLEQYELSSYVVVVFVQWKNFVEVVAVIVDKIKTMFQKWINTLLILFYSFHLSVLLSFHPSPGRARGAFSGRSRTAGTP